MSMSAVVHEDLSRFHLGDRLAKARKTAKLPPSVMAELLGVHRNSISNYESGRQTPSLGQVIAWATITGESLLWLIGNDYPLSERATALLSGDTKVLEFFPSNTEVATLLVLESARQRFALDPVLMFKADRLIQRAS